MCIGEAAGLDKTRCMYRLGGDPSASSWDTLAQKWSKNQPLDHYAIFIAILLLQLHPNPSLMLILSLMKSHHIGDSTVFSMMHNMSSIGPR